MDGWMVGVGVGVVLFFITWAIAVWRIFLNLQWETKFIRDDCIDVRRLLRHVIDVQIGDQAVIQRLRSANAVTRIRADPVKAEKIRNLTRALIEQRDDAMQSKEKGAKA